MPFTPPSRLYHALEQGLRRASHARRPQKRPVAVHTPRPGAGPARRSGVRSHVNQFAGRYAKLAAMKLIFLYGPVAAGKLTVGREIATLTGFALFHNHLVIDAVKAVFPFASEPFVRLREQFWLAMFHEAAAAGRSTIFTFAPEASVAPDFPERARGIVEAAGGSVAFVRLTIDPHEQERRVDTHSRAEFGKLRSLALLRQIRQQLAECEAMMPTPSFTVDTTFIPPSEAARSIAQGLGLLP